MKKFKYKIPADVETVFLNDKIQSIVYDGRKYEKELYHIVKKLGIFEEYFINELMMKYDLLFLEDFVEVIIKDDVFTKDLDNLIEKLVYPENGKYSILTIYNTLYANNLTFVLNSNNIMKIDDYSGTGINNDLRGFLTKKKKNILEFKFHMINNVNFDDYFEEIFKYYYYEPEIEKTGSSAAGTLTGWLTPEDMRKRTEGKIVIKLNRNFRLKKGRVFK